MTDGQSGEEKLAHFIWQLCNWLNHDVRTNTIVLWEIYLVAVVVSYLCIIWAYITKVGVLFMLNNQQEEACLFESHSRIDEVGAYHFSGFEKFRTGSIVEPGFNPHP